MESISTVTFARERLFLLNIFIGSWRLGMLNSGTVETIAKRTAPLCTMKGALHDGVNISVCENNRGFSDPVTMIVLGCGQT